MLNILIHIIIIYYILLFFVDFMDFYFESYWKRIMWYFKGWGTAFNRLFPRVKLWWSWKRPVPTTSLAIFGTVKPDYWFLLLLIYLLKLAPKLHPAHFEHLVRDTIREATDMKNLIMWYLYDIILEFKLYRLEWWREYRRIEGLTESADFAANFYSSAEVNYYKELSDMIETAGLLYFLLTHIPYVFARLFDITYSMIWHFYILVIPYVFNVIVAFFIKLFNKLSFKFFIEFFIEFIKIFFVNLFKKLIISLNFFNFKFLYLFVLYFTIRTIYNIVNKVKFILFYLISYLYYLVVNYSLLLFIFLFDIFIYFMSKLHSLKYVFTPILGIIFFGLECLMLFKYIAFIFINLCFFKFVYCLTYLYNYFLIIFNRIFLYFTAFSVFLIVSFIKKIQKNFFYVLSLNFNLDKVDFKPVFYYCYLRLKGVFYRKNILFYDRILDNYMFSFNLFFFKRMYLFFFFYLII